MVKLKSFSNAASQYVKSIPKALLNSTLDLLESSDFISRTVGMANSYNDIMAVVQSLGREPVSLLGKDYLFIFDHVRRNYKQGTTVMSSDYNSNGSTDDGNGYGCKKFTFYKEVPTVRFANVDADPLNFISRWMPSVSFETSVGKKTLISYAESSDGNTDNMVIDQSDNNEDGNTGVNYGTIRSFENSLSTCDMIRKTNDNFNHGKYETLIARFHTNADSSKRTDDITQTAVSSTYGMSHGRNLCKRIVDYSEGYDNPYCRVWTYHHQYNQLSRAIRPFGYDENTAKKMELTMSNHTGVVSFRSQADEKYGFKGGSERLDKYGVLNYRNGLVNIAPTAKIVDYFHKSDEKDMKNIETKKCMFSIENLAWKNDYINNKEYDKYGLSPEQKGPLGGRIMWFPPYEISFNESVNTNWGENDFIGRGEKIYTYTNTERTGNLSFTLLIDHPSILDYWTGHARNGKKNKGIDLADGDSTDVSTIDNQENTLLRFFAGCEMLTAKPQKYRKKKVKPKKFVENIEPEPIKKTTEKKSIHCVLYYPNNYSGIDDAPLKTSTVNAIHYLMNGIGAQKMINETTKEAEDLPTTISLTPYIMKEESNIEGVILDHYGGYEKRDNESTISITVKPLNPDYETIRKTYADLVSKEKKGEYITGEDGRKLYFFYNEADKDKNLCLAKYVGSKALGLASAKIKKNLENKPYNWYRRRWYYRVDNEYQNDMLSTKESYLDTQSFGLNSELGYKKLTEIKDISSAFGVTDEDNVKLISFTDLFAALEKDANKDIYDGLINQDNVNLVQDIMENKEKYKITKITFQGHASFQGYKNKNNTLATNRAATFKKWMTDCGFPNMEGATSEVKTQMNKDKIDKGYNSTVITKLWRSASVIIEYDETSLSDINAETSSTDTKDKIEVPNGEESMKTMNMSTFGVNGGIDNMLDASYNEILLKETANSLNITKSYLDGKMFPNFGSTTTLKELRDERDKKEIVNNDMKNLREYTKNIEKSMDDFLNEKLEKQGEIDVERYDNEGEFFEQLGEKDPFMHNLITQKIRYFDPAFHSISPEGFNARLNFLHQCTRQGSTVDASNGKAMSTAYNLSFGRPPVCVLRLGDFYNTKIIIKSLSIQYDNVQWDLNPEGIGVMPVFAKISLSFVFLGGSDLSGPISRLQNAVSFNYYANTGVYDNRAEMVEYNSDGSGREIKFKPYSYPDMLHQFDVSGLKPTAYGEKAIINEFNDKTDSPAIGKDYVNGETIKY